MSGSSRLRYSRQAAAMASSDDKIIGDDDVGELIVLKSGDKGYGHKKMI